MWLIRSVIALVGIIGFLWLGMNNADQRVDFFFFTGEYPSVSLNFIMLIAFACGMVFAFFLFIWSEFQLRNRIGRQHRQIDRLERELAALRNLPLEEGEAERAPV